MFNKRNNTDEEIVKSLRRNALFRDLDNKDINEVLNIAHIREYSENERIFSKGTIGICFYYIIKGSVEIVNEGSSDLNILRSYNEGDFFSEIHLFRESQHSVSSVAKDLTTLLVISRPDFDELIKLKPRTGSRLLLNMLEFFAEQLDKLYRDNSTLTDKILKINVE